MKGEEKMRLTISPLPLLIFNIQFHSISFSFSLFLSNQTHKRDEKWVEPPASPPASLHPQKSRSSFSVRKVGQWTGGHDVAGHGKAVKRNPWTPMVIIYGGACDGGWVFRRSVVVKHNQWTGGREDAVKRIRHLRWCLRWRMSFQKWWSRLQRGFSSSARDTLTPPFPARLQQSSIPAITGRAAFLSPAM